MFNKIALANSLASLAAIIYLATLALFAAYPDLFKVVFNALFLGTELADRFPAAPTAAEVLTNFIVFTASCWVLGYLWGWLYNSFDAKK